MDIKKARKAYEQGDSVDVGALLDFVERLHGLLEKSDVKIAELERKIEKLPKSVRLEEPYSVAAEEKRQQEADSKKRRKAHNKSLKNKLGRKTNDAKLKAAARSEPVYPTGFPTDQCVLSHTRPVWRLEKNKAVIVAYQVYSLGLSLDKVILLTQFFQDLKIGKSQIDSMLNQLARHLEGEFDNLCSLTANSMILHADETSWSIRSVWAFITEKARVLLHGVHKDTETLQAIINPAVFGGLVISDDAAVYGRFEIYRSAKRLKADGRYSDRGRHDATLEIQDRLHALICPECEKHEGNAYEGALEEYRLLICELLKLSVDDALFTFVTTPTAVRPNGTELPASGTNNEAERTLRPAARARNTDQASKTTRGARRRTIIVSTMESIRCYVHGYTLASITDELLSWQTKGNSCFERTLQSIEDCIRSVGVLATLYPSPQAG